MKLPNKVTSYRKSILYKLPPILKLLKEKDYTVNTLFDSLQNKMTISEYIEALDCLFVLGQIIINKEVLHYVERN